MLEIESPNERLVRLANLYKKRNEEYGNTYMLHGKVLRGIFCDAVPACKTDNDASRLSCLNMIVSKLIRYAQNFERGGHADSLDDISVYAQMLRELDDIAKDDEE